MICELQSVTVYPFTNGKRCIIKSNQGRLMCTDESLFDALKDNEGKELDLVVENPEGAQYPVIMGIVGMEVATNDAPDEDMPFEVEPSETQEILEAHEEPAEKKKPERKRKPSKPAEEQLNDADAADAYNPAVEFDSADIKQETEGLTKADELKVFAPFPLLRADEIEVRVNQVYEDYATLLLYKNARCDQERLDAKYGPLGWQKSYQMIGDKLYCIVSVKNQDTGEWVSKSDVGTESNQDAAKGEASDAFKRACVVWGSGRELYSAPYMSVRASDTDIRPNPKKQGAFVCKDTFVVQKIAYNENRKISAIEIYSVAKKRVVFKWSEPKK